MNNVKVTFNDEVFESDNFICMIDTKDGLGLMFNTNALNLGIAVQMLAVSYKEELEKLPLEEQEAIKEALSLHDIAEE